MSEDNKLLMLARVRLAELWSAAFHKRAILSGQWDSGTLMKAMLDKVTAEAIASREEDNADD